MVGPTLRYAEGPGRYVEHGLVLRLSGTRAVLYGTGTPLPTFNRLYDVRTGKIDALGPNSNPWSYGAVDAFGNYLAYSTDKSGRTEVRRRDQSTGKDVLVASAPKIKKVAVYGNLVAWLTDCREGVWPCAQTVAYRTVGATGVLGPVKSFATRGTISIDLSATHLALDTLLSRREVRIVTLGANAVRVVGTLPAKASSGWIPPLAIGDRDVVPVHFDLDGNRIGWLDANQTARVAAVDGPATRARYLGNGVIPASFPSTGKFSASLPFSANPSKCTVTFKKGTTAVRIMPCVVRNGDVQLSWDARTGSGAKVAKGKYSWTLTASTPAGRVLWYSGTASPITAAVTVS
ncbi:hypothetical protein OG394_23480 [Kribbella sp. NBC_01245]|uniref:hypothetical protein n=1 Tax=Kribbella sp. NBC_01245 TaxID=2903578 RepID=UPI002E2B9C65|nr:hypothetical protein [Kribbella sp. NBC_01245]